MIKLISSVVPMPPLSSDQIRHVFVQFWEERGAHVQPSSSLIPHNDPTVLLTTAGMQQFVPYFLGVQTSPFPRYVSVQKCFRTSDIDEVGDRSHLTFFEMLGNFSVGDYFKDEVIPWALEFLTRHLGFDVERLHVTVHETDDEAEQIWLRLGIPAARIIRRGDEDNWWGPPGTSGPCGPDSEIYFAQGPGHGCGFPGDPPDCECGRLEIWNLVFMQFFQDEQGNRTPLPRKNVDTGMGLERVAAVAAGAGTVYETDLFLPIVQMAAGFAGVMYGQDERADEALRVLADHGRAMTFLVGDGVVPGTTGREYVLRRVVRRAVRFGRVRLGMQQPFLRRLADAVIDRMGPHYPDLEQGRGRILQVLETEEELFGRTIRTGLAQLERLTQEVAASGGTVLSGAQVFDLYQTYGFPPELTEEILREQGLAFSWDDYRAALEREQSRGRARSSFGHAKHEGANQFPDVPETQFLAWTDTTTDTRVLALSADGSSTVELPAGLTARLVLEASPFYPEGGGQVGDAGYIRTGEGLFQVEDTRFDGAGHVVHFGQVVEGSLRAGALARAEVDRLRRERTMRHHTVTHLLHRALKDVLGEGTSQQGSLVSPDLARFDFNFPRAMSREELQAVASIVNDRTMQDLPVHWEVMPMEQARKTGAVMMFGEKYGDQVRVVSIGDYSKELCGGTHTHHSGQLGLAVIATEAGIGSGKRRIVAFAGEAAHHHLAERTQALERLIEQVGARSVEDASQRIESILRELDEARRELERARSEQSRDVAGQLATRAQPIEGVNVVAEAVDGADDDVMKQLVDRVREQIRSGAVVLATVRAGQPRFVVGVTRDLAGSRLHAGNLLKEVARVAGGGGGGRPDFATGGGGEPSRLSAALDAVPGVVRAMLLIPGNS